MESCMHWELGWGAPGRRATWKGKDEVPEMDGCTTKWIYLMPQSVHLKIVEMINFILCIFYLNQSTEIMFLPRGVLPRKWYPACVQWCFHQPLQARKHLLPYRSPWPPLSGIQAYKNPIKYSSNSELYLLWNHRPLNVAISGDTTSWSLYIILKVEFSSPGRVAQLVGALSHITEGCRFNSCQGTHRRQPIGVSHINVSPSLPPLL